MTAIRKTSLQVAYFQGFTNLTTDLCTSNDRFGFKSGVPLFGKDGAFHRVLEDFLNAALEGEMDSHLIETKPATKNRRNGKMPKQLQTETVDS